MFIIKKVVILHYCFRENLSSSELVKELSQVQSVELSPKTKKKLVKFLPPIQAVDVEENHGEYQQRIKQLEEQVKNFEDSKTIFQVACSFAGQFTFITSLFFLYFYF